MNNPSVTTKSIESFDRHRNKDDVVPKVLFTLAELPYIICMSVCEMTNYTKVLLRTFYENLVRRSTELNAFPALQHNNNIQYYIKAPTNC